MQEDGHYLLYSSVGIGQIHLMDCILVRQGSQPAVFELIYLEM